MKYAYDSVSQGLNKKLFIFIPMLLIIAILVLINLVPNSVVFSNNSNLNTNSFAIGADLNQYKIPSNDKCDINVPAQYSTIQEGVNASVPGDDICVGPGIYNENVYINKPVRVHGSGVSESIINGQITDENPGYYTVYFVSSKATLEGFTITGAGTTTNLTTILISGDQFSNIKIQYNHVVSGNGEPVLRADSFQNNVLIANNILEGNNSPIIAWIGDGNEVNFINNTFIGSVNPSSPFNSGVLFENTSNNLISKNVFNTTGASRIIISVPWTTVISKNNLGGTAQTKVVNISSEGPLIAEKNWWGDIDPSDNIQGDVDFSPYSTKQYNEN